MNNSNARSRLEALAWVSIDQKRYIELNAALEQFPVIETSEVAPDASETDMERRRSESPDKPKTIERTRQI